MEDGKRNGATIRQRENVRSLRRRDGLIRFARDATSQNGEDGILERIFELLPPPDDESGRRYLVDVGAWDGRHLSNTYSLLTSHTSSWKGILIEADAARFQQLKELHEPRGNTCICQAVSGIPHSPSSLEQLLREAAPSIGLPHSFDFLCIDIDGADYHVWKNLLEDDTFRPKVACIEFNPTMPNDLIYIPPQNDELRHGASLAALVELAHQHSYVLVETTLYNAFFVDQQLFELYLRQEVPDTSIEALHETTMGTSLYQLYDGTLKLAGCKKLLWHRLPIDEGRIQMVSKHERHFPFAPTNDNNDIFDETQVVDMSPYCALSSSTDLEQHELCSRELLRLLRRDGFCYVRGTGIAKERCQKALEMTHAFLEQAHEDVRRSAMHRTDRARRGYSPNNTENFASLLGQEGPNDLVRKFRIGPSNRDDDEDRSGGALLQPNIWPDDTLWDRGSEFRSTIESYYRDACSAALAVVRAICKGLFDEDMHLSSSLLTLAENESNENETDVGSDAATTTSILTLLGYRHGSRHKGKTSKSPLLAPHTDVGVITFLIFDRGSCASLQRKARADEDAEWVDVTLPQDVPEDPIFVVNVADCLSELSGGKLPSTLHRVAACRAVDPSNVQSPRSCCALFVGLDPDCTLNLNGVTLTYEEWRKARIARAQSVLKRATS